MIKIVSLYIFIILTTNYSVAQNLVKNPSFEDTINCPTGPGQMSNCKNWSSVNPSPDYFNACNSGEMSIPDNLRGYNFASHGKAYLGLATFLGYRPNGREIIQGELKTELELNKKYFFSFKVSMAERSAYASNNMGIAFSVAPFPNLGNKLIHRNNAKSKGNEIIKDSVNWVTISGSFIADSNYRYIQIGNFYSDSLTDTVNINLTQFILMAYYYLDEVCVSSDSSTCIEKLGINSQLNDSEIKMYPNPFQNALNVELNNTGSRKNIYIYNSNSQLIFKDVFFDHIDINTSSFPPGLYSILVTDSEGILKTKTMIKNQ